MFMSSSASTFSTHKMGSCLFPTPIHRLKSWRKASKCKKLIKRVVYRIKFLQARKAAIIAQTRDDIAKLLQHGHFQRASNLVEQLYKDKCGANVYEVIEEICQCISNNLTCITSNRDMPMDVNVALLNLNFAASRCGELPELNRLRSIFRDLHGDEFEAFDVNLQPETMVKSELRTLSAGSVSDDVKLKLIKDITKDFSVIMCVPKTCQQIRPVYDIHEEQHEMEQDHNGRRLEKKPDPGYATKKASNEYNEMKVKEDIWPRKTTENMHQIQEENIVYQNGIKEKPPPQSYCNSEAAVLSLDSKGVRKRTLCSCSDDIQAYQPLPQESSKKQSNKHIHFQNSTVDDTKVRIQTQASSTDVCLNYNNEAKRDVQRNRKRTFGHVHPKLPQYEDLEVMFKHPIARVGN